MPRLSPADLDLMEHELTRNQVRRDRIEQLIAAYRELDEDHLHLLENFSYALSDRSSRSGAIDAAIVGEPEEVPSFSAGWPFVAAVAFWMAVLLGIAYWLAQPT